MHRASLLFWIFLLPVLPACEEVIHVDLNQAAPRLVIEGIVTDAGDRAVVYLSQTRSFTEETGFTGVSGANIYISENQSEPVLLTETAPGVYQSPTPMGAPGNTYSLRVETQSEIYTATSAMPLKIPADSLYFRKEVFPGQSYILPYIAFRDPGGQTDYYRFRLLVNGTFLRRVDVYDDEYTDGLAVQEGLFYLGDEDNADPADDDGLLPGDEVTVEMQCIDYGVYRYFFTLRQTLEQSAVSPANPESNISGGALGYFNACTTQQITRTVPNLP
jgi:hypothetical protein